MLDAVQDMPGLRMRSLYDLYPDFHIDAAAEQAALRDASLIVWQHPMHWYGTPPLFGMWMDKVLEHGWAYGADGQALRGKQVMWAVTTGGASTDFMRCADTDLAVLAQPLRSAAELCGMRWLPPHALHGVATLDAAALQAASARYRDLLAAHAQPAPLASTELAHG
jgi:glutathione-regulated potassium-efflux system ancillary protein KefF